MAPTGASGANTWLWQDRRETCSQIQQWAYSLVFATDITHHCHPRRLRQAHRTRSSFFLLKSRLRTAPQLRPLDGGAKRPTLLSLPADTVWTGRCSSVQCPTGLRTSILGEARLLIKTISSSLLPPSLARSCHRPCRRGNCHRLHSHRSLN
jgi:hypothetical protein